MQKELKNLIMHFDSVIKITWTFKSGAQDATEI